MFLRVPAVLIKRQKQHFHSLPCGVDVILGNNGYVWLSAPTPTPQPDAGDAPRVTRDVSAVERERICRVRNCIVALSRVSVPIYAASIMDVYTHSSGLGLSASALLDPAKLQQATQTATSRHLETQARAAAK